MIKSQLRAFDLTAQFFHTFRSIKYKHVPVVRAMAYPFHLDAVNYYKRAKPSSLRMIRSPRHMYDKLIATDRVTAVPYQRGKSENSKTIFSSLVIEGLGISINKNIICMEVSKGTRLKAPYYNPEAAGRLQTAYYNSLLRKIKSIVRKKGVHPYFKRSVFMKWLSTQLRSVMRKIDGIEQLFSKNNINAIIQASSVNPMGYLLVHMGKQRRIPTLNIQYGLLDTYQILSTNVDHYIAWGEQHRNRLTRYGAPKPLFQLLGNARFDPIYSGKWLLKAQLSKKLNISSAKTIFVYAEQPLKPLYNRIAMKRIIQALLPFRSKVALLVKKHPRQKGSGLSAAMMRKYPFAKLIHNRKIRLYDLLNGADSVLVQFSTTGLEAMLFNKPVIALSFFPNTNKHEYSYYASSKLLTSAKKPRQLKRIITSFLNVKRYRKTMINKQQKYLLGAYNGGKNANHSIKEFIQSMK